MLRLASFSIAACVSLAAPFLHAEEPVSVQTGDMIVWVGNTFVERAATYGHLETAISLAAGPEVAGLRFRNLGWSGDSITNESRAYFGPPEEGQTRLIKGISELKPNILFLTYGTVEAMEGASEAGLEAFRNGLSRVVKDLKQAAGPQLREVVFITPPPLENLGGFLPDQSKNNASLARYVEVTESVAEASDSKVVDLFAALGGAEFDGQVTEAPLTENGVHYTDAGYREVASALVRELGLTPLEYPEQAMKALEELRDLTLTKNRLFFHRWALRTRPIFSSFGNTSRGRTPKRSRCSTRW